MFLTTAVNDPYNPPSFPSQRGFRSRSSSFYANDTRSRRPRSEEEGEEEEENVIARDEEYVEDPRVQRGKNGIMLLGK